jgi:hypothetical protein
MNPFGLRLIVAAGVAAVGLLAAGCPKTGSDPFAGPSPFELGPERMMTADLSLPADAPAVAWNGEDFFVVWSARRAGATDLFGARIAPDGNPVDRSPRLISSSPGNQKRPSVAWGRDLFLVVWEDDRSGVSRIIGARITPRGDVLEPNGFAIAGGRREQTAPLVTWTGSRFMIVWAETFGGVGDRDLYGTALDPAINATAPGGMPLVVAPGDQFQPAVAWGPDFGLLVWSDGRSGGSDPSLIDLYAERLGLDGRRLDPDTLLVTGAAGPQSFPAAAWDGTQFDLVWVDRREGRDLIYGTAISAKGLLRNPGGLPITSGPAENGPPALALAGNDMTGRAMEQIVGQMVGFWTEIGQGQQLAVGRVWPNGFEPLPSLAGPVTYVQADSAPRLQAAATNRGELLVVWAGLSTGSGAVSQIFSRQIAVKETVDRSQEPRDSSQ